MTNEAARAAASTTARIVWDTADKYLRNVVEPQEYGDYILPFTVLRRLECLLEDTKEDVIEFVEACSGMPPILIDIAVAERFGLSFYNVSPLSLASIASVDDNVDKALLSYVNGFSHNITDIWTAFEFPKLVEKLSEANRLLEVVKHFSTLSLGSTSVEDSTMGDIFEDVMYRAFDKKGKAAGAFYTPRDAIKLMVDVLFAADAESLAGEDVLRSIYDPTAGSGGMLLVAQEALRQLNPGVKVTVYGQEMMPSAYALGKADLLIQGGRPDAILKGDTLLEDLHADKTFDYVLSNPPFGGDWEVEQESVKEQAQVPGSRFSHGLPKQSDGQMLFLCHCASKLSPSGGRAAVVSNASPLFSSDLGSNSIRQWLFDEDLIDAIIALPTRMFYGTDIATYVWILDNDKPLKRRGKIQLLDASSLWEPMRKGMGDKRREMSEANREAVVQAYQRFEESEISQILTPRDFMFRDVPVFKQARLAARFSDEAVDALRGRRDFSETLVRVVRGLDGAEWNELPERIRAAAKAEGIKAPVGLVDAVMKAMAVPDENAPLAVDRKGTPVLADGWKIVERVPVMEDVDEHMAAEVLPYVSDATWDVSKAKEGNEIPFSRMFYVPEEPRPLSEIDADVQRIMGELREMFEEVSRG
ncbi:type I restriction-modification system subunit M [Xylanimonas cellulosilytica]|uniref:type I restriction-modification system subunit M n=1 Tax=Xylanimonas cellulosilytica TaxID=186189 RepID=UPI000661504C|nr:class I SAM-dependent DNA methyltransferase [Xylanimonas cellulosilytica]